ncbi:MAG TPA: hypothetical protein PLE50_05760, partial [Rhabdaerophilum sp.]|nr:hypothetical protein [Rhabdaerophilum sp.]
MLTLKRWLILLAVLAAAAAFSWFAYQRFTSPLTWRIAVSQHRADDAVILERVGEWLKLRARRTRLDVQMVADEDAA